MCVYCRKENRNMLKLFDAGGPKLPHGRHAMERRRRQNWQKSQEQSDMLRQQLSQANIANQGQGQGQKLQNTPQISRINSYQTLDPTSPFPQSAQILLGKHTYNCQIVIGGAFKGGNQFRKKKDACRKIEDIELRRACFSKYQWEKKPSTASNTHDSMKPVPIRENSVTLPRSAKISVGLKNYNCDMISEGGKKATKRKKVESKKPKKTQKPKKTSTKKTSTKKTKK